MNVVVSVFGLETSTMRPRRPELSCFCLTIQRKYGVSCLPRLSHDPSTSSPLKQRSSKNLKLLVICEDDGTKCGANKMGLACSTHESIQT